MPFEATEFTVTFTEAEFFAVESAIEFAQVNRQHLKDFEPLMEALTKMRAQYITARRGKVII